MGILGSLLRRFDCNAGFELLQKIMETAFEADNLNSVFMVHSDTESIVCCDV